jgi:hypothetical protein
LSSRPERTRISYLAVPSEATYAAFRKESRMKFANANKLDRKSGVTQWRDLRFLSFTLLPRRNPYHSVRKAWTGLMEAARWAGMTLATRAQNPKAAMEPASTSGSQLFTW